MTAGIAARVRLMTAADLDAVVALAARLPTAPQWPREVYRKAMDATASLQRIALVAERGGGGVAGFAVASVMAPEAELESICVDATLQRSGLGRMILAALMDQLHAAGVWELHLEVRAGNEAARAFYAAAGFRPAGIRPRYYADPVEDAAILSLAVRQR